MNLKEKGIQLFKQLGWTTANANALTQQLISYHASSSRHYHNTTHLEALYQSLEAHQSQIIAPQLLELVIWFHDSVYKSWRKDNEVKSARLAANALKNHVHQQELDLISTIIESTAKHIPLTQHPDCQWFLDFDLKILASEPKTYDWYARAIRKEYWIYPNFLYNKGRKQALEAFLNRDRLFYTDQFHEQYEAKARENMKREIASLSRHR